MLRTDDSSAVEFAASLLKLGNGAMASENQDVTISMNNTGKTVATLQQRQDAAFPNVAHNFHDHKWLCQRAILAPKNDVANSTNRGLLTQLPGTMQMCKSVDTVPDTTEAVHCPTEFFNSLELPGVPPHNLELKLGAPIILLRNLDPPTLCNGTRLAVKKLMPHVIEATIITGLAAGQDVFIPRNPIIPSDLPFQFRRLQFPVRISFAMSINKAV